MRVSVDGCRFVRIRHVDDLGNEYTPGELILILTHVWGVVGHSWSWALGEGYLTAEMGVWDDDGNGTHVSDVELLQVELKMMNRYLEGLGL